MLYQYILEQIYFLMIQYAGQHIIHENIYDKYSAMLFGMLLEICPSREAAEKVMVTTFKKLFKQQGLQQNNPCLFVKIIKLAMESASEQSVLLQPGRCKNFKESPLLQQVLFQNRSMKDCEDHFQLDKTTIGKMLRHEIMQLRAVKV